MGTAHAQGWFAMLRTLVQFEKWDAMLDERDAAARSAIRGRRPGGTGRAPSRRPTRETSPPRGKSRRPFDQALADFQKRTNRPDAARVRSRPAGTLGHIDAAEGHVDRALKRLEAASKAERKLTYTEPPYYPRPVAEALGHLATRNHKPAVAEKAFAAALEQYPATRTRGKNRR